MGGYGGLADDSNSQVEKLLLALEELMVSHPNKIFFHLKELEKFCIEKWPNWPKQYEANGGTTTVGSSIRRVLNTNSSDSKYFGLGARTALNRESGGKHDLFMRGGNALWGIRNTKKPEESVMRVESFNCGRQVASCYPEIESLLNALWKLKLPVSEGYAKYPAHNPIFNAMMDMVGEKLGWKSQPYVLTKQPRVLEMKGDLAKIMPDDTRVFVEIEIGNEASVFRDIVKFDVSSKMQTYDFFIFVLPGSKAASRLGYAMSFDAFVKKRDFFQRFISIPLIVVEIEPDSDFDLNSYNGGEPVGKDGRWGMQQSRNFIEEKGLQHSLGII